ncbi:MAG: CDP-alcohol phosphatidyltransferase family protein, partial [Chloroflexota bacterium]
MAGVALARSAARRRVSAGVWGFALLSATAADWFDGPLARRQPGGPTAWGALLDIEADSWLTLLAAYL